MIKKKAKKANIRSSKKQIEIHHNIIRSFFDLYLIDFLFHFKDNTRISDNKKLDVVILREMLIEEWYAKVGATLKDAVKSEIRHINDSTVTPEIYYPYAEINQWPLEKVAKTFIKRIKFSNGRTKSRSMWIQGFGGKPWHDATKLLIEFGKHKTLNEKLLFVDRVMDLYHNTGHILNKSIYRHLSHNKFLLFNFSDIKEKEYRYDQQNALNYRKHASLKNQLKYCSSIVYKLSKYYHEFINR